MLGLDDVSLVGGTGTVYTCNYTNDSHIIIIPETKSFNIELGTIKLEGELSLAFVYIESSGKIRICNVEFEFVGEIEKVIYAEGGSILFEYVRVINVKTYWVNRFIFVNNTYSACLVEFFSCIFDNCSYNNSVGNISGICEIRSSNNLPCFLNISTSYFINSNFSTTNTSVMTAFFFYGFHPSSGFFYLIHHYFIPYMLFLYFFLFFSSMFNF
jgi:hypothetical protein